MPSSLLEQVDRAEVRFASNSQILENEEHQSMERMRQEAAAAFHWLDSHERLRMALNSRSRPPHLKADALAATRPEQEAARFCHRLSGTGSCGMC